jgi:hypothetical protein
LAAVTGHDRQPVHNIDPFGLRVRAWASIERLFYECAGYADLRTAADRRHPSRMQCVNIPAKTNRKQTFSFGRWVCRQRNLVKRFCNRIEQMGGLATRCDRRADNYLAAFKVSAKRIWIASAKEPVS